MTYLARPRVRRGYLSIGLVLLALLLIVGVAEAGLWKITVSNPTKSKGQVQGIYMAADGGYMEEVIIEPGGSYTWTCPGTLCSAGVVGRYFDSQANAWRKMRDTGCLGN